MEIPLASKNLLSSTLTQTNIKTLKFSEIYKQLYSKQSGNAIKILKQTKQSFKSQENLINNRNSINHRSYESTTYRNLNDYTKATTFYETVKRGKTQFLNNNEKIIDESKLEKMERTLITNQKMAYTSRNVFPDLHLKTKNSFTNQNQKFYCPFCEHCNTFKENSLDNFISYTKESKSILNKGFEYIINSGILKNKNNFLYDLESLENNKEEVYYEERSNINNKNQFDIEALLSNFPKQILPQRLIIKTLNSFLNALIEDKLTLENLISPDLTNKLKDSMFSKGHLYKISKDEIEFDKEIEYLFDDKSKRILKALNKNNNLNFSFDKIEDNNNLQQDRRKFSVLYLVFMQILSDIYKECKERAILLYKIFKLYFVETERKWIEISNQLKNKIKKYREISEMILNQKYKSMNKIEEINAILLDRSVNQENLNSHKKIIYSLIETLNNKKEEMYMLSSKNEIIEKEVKLWIYDFDNIKCSNEIKKRLIGLDCAKILKNVTDEYINNKSITKEEKSILVNAERLIIASGQKNVMYEQKFQLHKEIERLTHLYNKNYFKKREWKKSYKLKHQELLDNIKYYEMEIKKLKEKDSYERFNKEVQTDYDYFMMNNLIKNNQSVTYAKQLTESKLTNFVERIKFGCSKYKPIPINSLLFLIPQLYEDKIMQDSKAEVHGSRKNLFDTLFYDFFKNKFKIKKIMKKHCEETIMSIFLYSNEDSRIDLFRRFLGIGEGKIRREVLDQYLIILKSLPLSYFKIFEESSNIYTLLTEFCFEIYYEKLHEFNLINENKVNILKSTKVYAEDKEVEKISDDVKLEYLLLSRFYNKSLIFIGNLIALYKDGQTTEKLTSFYDHFSFTNKEFRISNDQFNHIFTKHFSVNDLEVDLESFFNFFKNSYYFKIKVIDFLEITLYSLINYFDLLEKQINKYYGMIQFKYPEFISLIEFSELIHKITNEDNRWKVSDYFKIALNGQEKDFLTKEEFITFCLNDNSTIRSSLNRLVSN